MKLELFNTSDDALRALTRRMIALMEKSVLKPFHLALSGGETSKMLFRIWVEEFQEQINWGGIRFYWVNERCVAPEHPDSNFKYAEEILFRPLDISLAHVHRIRGEMNPEYEADYYSELVRWELPGHAETPRFDCIILGVGVDGRTASIFPSDMELLIDRRCYAVSHHPDSGQARVTMTGTTILRATTLLFPVVGVDKTVVLHSLMESASHETVSPASYILAHARSAMVFTDCALE